MELRIVKNFTAMEQSCVHEGSQVVLKPREEKVVAASIAAAFVTQCSPYVREIAQSIAGVHRDQATIKTMWIANMTGDPDASDQVDTKVFKDKHWVTEKTPNPKKDAIEISRELDLGMREYVGQDGSPAGLNMGKKRIIIPPYQRIELPESEAYWFLNRDHQQMSEMRGAALRSRAPSNFEPDMSWSLDDMRDYLRLCDSKVDIGPTQAEVTNRCRARKDRERATEVAVFEAKLACMKRIHFRVCNPAIRLPLRAQFDEFQTEKYARLQTSPIPPVPLEGSQATA